MPSVRSLAMELSINPNTIQKAFSLLETQGYIYPVKGRGNFVADTAALAEKEKQLLLEEAEKLIRQGKELGIARSEYDTPVPRGGIQMIELKDLDKTFDDIRAADHITGTIRSGMVFGLIGSNGAGKSTLLRMISGVIRPDGGELLVDGKPVYENPEIKSQICFLSDTPYYFQNADLREMRDYYATVYPSFNRKQFDSLTGIFHLDMKRRINSFSKGMKKQVSILLGLCAGTKYLLCDETFDGLDPVVRQAVKSLFAAELVNRDFTPVIASHNLRELEDFCDSIGLLHQGKLLLTEDIDQMRSKICKLQCVIQNPLREQEFLRSLPVIKSERTGSVLTLTVRGERSEVMRVAEAQDPLFLEVLPLTLEEIFISETEVAGYDIKDFFLH